MPPRDIGTPGGECEFLESSQIDVENVAIETPTASSLPRAQDKEYQDSEGEDPSVTDGADGDYQGNNAPSKPRIVLNTPRLLRSAAAKQEPTRPGSPTSSRTETSNLRKRDREKHEDEVMRPEKRGRKPAVNTEVKKFETTIHGLLEEFKAKAHDFENSKTRNQGLRLQNTSLKKDLKQAQQDQKDQKQLEALQSSKITQLQNECSKLRRKLEAVIDASKKDLGKYTKVSDSDIAAEWGKLSFNIRNLVSQCLTKPLTNECDEIETLMKRMKKLLPLSFCNVASLRVAVLRRTIWYMITSAIFSGMRPVWYGEAGQMLTQVLLIEGKKYYNKPSCLKMLSQMKFRAIAGLNDGPQLDEKSKVAIFMLLDAAKSMLSKFIPDSMMEQFEAKMSKLIVDAIDLHTMMMCSKAIFFQRWLGDDNGAKFALYDRETMESMQSDVDAYTSRYFVEFVEAPALIKYGNADGEDFEFHMILWKSSVILGELEPGSNSEDKSMHRAIQHDEGCGKCCNWIEI